MVRQDLLTVGIKHAVRVAASRATRDAIPGNTVIPTMIRGAILAGIFHFISHNRRYTSVDEEIIDVEIV